jgi:hypothetical protein
MKEMRQTRKSHCVARVPKALRWAALPTCSLKAFPKGRKCRRVVASGVDKEDKGDRGRKNNFLALDP